MPHETITCPNCDTSIPVTDALTHQIKHQLKQELSTKQKEQELAFQRKQAEIEHKEKSLAEEKANVNAKIADSVSKKLESEKAAMWSKAQKIASDKAEEKMAAEMKSLTESVLEKDKELQNMRQAELALRKERNKLEQEKQNMQLEVARTLDTERKKIQEEAATKLEQQHRLQDMEKEKRITDMRQQIEELKRKAEQGSQQTQGEVLELELEEFLKSAFPYDTIEPVPKGINGADVLQHIHNQSGKKCGTLVWESKRTKAWSEGWIAKLKDDQRAVKAEVAILVTEALPKDVQNFEHRDGVWVCSYPLIAELAHVLRLQIMQVSAAKQMSLGQEGKMEVLYKYVTSTEFVHRVQAIVEAFSSMQADLEKERRLAERQWSKREKQIRQVISNTSGMYGDLQGLIGTSMQTIPALEEGDEE